MIMLVPLAMIVIFLGVYPSPILDLMNSSMNSLAEILRHAGSAANMSIQ